MRNALRLLLLFYCVSMCGQKPEKSVETGQFFTDGYLNGFAWKELLNDFEKKLYVAGFIDGSGFAEIGTERHIVQMNTDQVIKEMDALYSDQRNRVIAFPVVIFFIGAKQQGRVSDPEAKLSSLRKSSLEDFGKQKR